MNRKLFRPVRFKRKELPELNKGNSNHTICIPVNPVVLIFNPVFNVNKHLNGRITG